MRPPMRCRRNVIPTCGTPTSTRAISRFRSRTLWSRRSVSFKVTPPFRHGNGSARGRCIAHDEDRFAHSKRGTIREYLDMAIEAIDPTSGDVIATYHQMAPEVVSGIVEKV